MNEPIGTFRILEPGARTADRSRDDLDRFVLSDDSLVKLFLHRKQLGGFGLRELRYGNTRPRTDDVGDVFFGDFERFVEMELALLPLLLEALLLEPQLLLTVADRGRLFEFLTILTTASFSVLTLRI